MAVDMFDGNISQLLRSMMMRLSLDISKKRRRRVEPEDFLLASMQRDKIIHLICTKNKIGILDILRKIRLELDRISVLENENIFDKSEITQVSDIYISERLKLAFEKAHESFRSSYIKPLDEKAVIYTIFAEKIVDTDYILEKDPNLIAEILSYLEAEKSNNRPKIEERTAVIKSDNSNREKILKKISYHVKNDGENIKSLALAMARLAKLELAKLKSELPNSPEAIEERDSKIELMKIFIDGFGKIASDIQNINKNEKKSLNEVVKSVDSLSEALSKWWSAKNQRIIDVAVGMPVLVGATTTLKYCGVDPMVQNIVIGTTAVALYGKETVETAIKVAKSIKITDKNK